MAGVQHAALDFHQVVARRIVVDQRQRVRALASQAARRRVGLVAQPCHRREYPFARLFAHVGLVVEHAGHGLDRNPGNGGDILDSTAHDAMDPPGRRRARGDGSAWWPGRCCRSRRMLPRREGRWHVPIPCRDAAPWRHCSAPLVRPGPSLRDPCRNLHVHRLTAPGQAYMTALSGRTPQRPRRCAGAVPHARNFIHGGRTQ